MKLALFAAAALAGVLAASNADAKIVTMACKKDLATGDVTFDMSKITEDYTWTVVSFHKTSQDARYAYGTCTINLKYQPAD